MIKRLAALLSTLAVVTFVAPVPTASAQGFTNMSLSCVTLPLVANGFVEQHVTTVKVDDKFYREVARVWAESIDPTESLLTQAEYTKLEQRLFALSKAVAERNCADFAALHKDQIAWQKALEDHVRKVVSAKDFKIDTKRELELDPDKRDRPKTKKEQDALRAGLIDFQMANYLAGGISEKEARERLIHRYELFTRRVSEQSEADRFGIYLNSFAAAIDPHSNYFSPEDMEDFRIQMGLSLTGIGAVLSSRDGYTTVEEVVVGGAAEQHGKLRPKDQIIAVSQGLPGKGEVVDVIDMDLRDVVRLIRGPAGTNVTLTVLRKGESAERLQFTITRATVDLAESAATLKWETVTRGAQTLKVAIIDLPSFYMGEGVKSRDSAVDVRRLITEAKAGKADAMVLDLSRNGGGVLQSAVRISGLFIEQGAIVAAKERSRENPEVLSDRDIAVDWDGPLVVLTSRVSASASEILAGALQDYNRAVIVGDAATFGKGSVQQLSPLPPGLGSLKVTTALYYLPGGKSTQTVGVVPDILVPSEYSTLEIGERYQKNALAPATTKPFVSATANASNHWTPVDAATIKKLADQSKKRVAASNKFKELKKELAEADANKTKIKISDILNDKKKTSDEDEDAEAKKKKKDELSIQVLEAAQIAADLATTKKTVAKKK